MLFHGALHNYMFYQFFPDTASHEVRTAVFGHSLPASATIPWQNKSRSQLTCWLLPPTCLRSIRWIIFKHRFCSLWGVQEVVHQAAGEHPPASACTCHPIFGHRDRWYKPIIPSIWLVCPTCLLKGVVNSMLKQVFWKALRFQSGWTGTGTFLHPAQYCVLEG